VTTNRESRDTQGKRNQTVAKPHTTNTVGGTIREPLSAEKTAEVVAFFESFALLVAERAVDLVARCPSSPSSPYLSIAEAAEYLRCKPQRIYDLLSARRLAKYRDGTRVLVRRDELDAYVSGVTHALPPAAQPPAATRRAA
jgi:excisionase family DNA binding protein